MCLTIAESKVFRLPPEGLEHQTLATLRELQEKNRFTDLTFYTEDGGVFHSHTFLFRHRSALFRDWLHAQSQCCPSAIMVHAHLEMILAGVLARDLKAFLELLYTGEILVDSQQSWNSVRDIFHLLQMSPPGTCLVAVAPPPPASADVPNAFARDVSFVKEEAWWIQDSVLDPYEPGILTPESATETDLDEQEAVFVPPETAIDSSETAIDSSEPGTDPLTLTVEEGGIVIGDVYSLSSFVQVGNINLETETMVSKSWHCPVCDKTFPIWISFDQHMDRHSLIGTDDNAGSDLGKFDGEDFTQNTATKKKFKHQVVSVSALENPEAEIKLQLIPLQKAEKRKLSRNPLRSAGQKKIKLNCTVLALDRQRENKPKPRADATTKSPSSLKKPMKPKLKPRKATKSLKAAAGKKSKIHTCTVHALDKPSDIKRKLQTPVKSNSLTQLTEKTGHNPKKASKASSSSSVKKPTKKKPKLKTRPGNKSKLQAASKSLPRKTKPKPKSSPATVTCTCFKCGHLTRNKGDLKSHLIRCHCKEAIWKKYSAERKSDSATGCDICDKEFRDRLSLIRHLGLKHRMLDAFVSPSEQEEIY